MNHFLERNKEIFAFFRVIRGLIFLSRTDVKIAEKEVEFGETSSEILVSNEESPESKKDLAIIGVWHF